MAEEASAPTFATRREMADAVESAILAFAKLVLEQTIERCAKACDKLADDIDMERMADIRGETAANKLAGSIRAMTRELLKELE